MEVQPDGIRSDSQPVRRGCVLSWNPSTIRTTANGTADDPQRVRRKRKNQRENIFICWKDSRKAIELEAYQNHI
jgi:hypothetical protein